MADWARITFNHRDTNGLVTIDWADKVDLYKDIYDVVKVEIGPWLTSEEYAQFLDDNLEVNAFRIQEGAFHTLLGILRKYCTETDTNLVMTEIVSNGGL